MVAAKALITRIYRHLMHDTMHRNSSFLILSQAVASFCGFMFWVINAHLFSAQYVGLAASFISFGILTATFTNMGMTNTVIRFLPSSNRRGGIFSASLILVVASSLVGGVLALLLVNSLLPKLRFVSSSYTLSLIMILLVAGTAVGSVLDGTLISFRRSDYVLKKSIITNLPRLVLPFLLVGAGLSGMTGVFVFSLLGGIAYSLFVIKSRLLRFESLRPTLAEVRKHRSYAASNYFGGMFAVLPATLVPIGVLSILGASSAAYFYMPMMLVGSLSVICASVSQALMAECSQDNNIAQHRASFARALRHQFRLLIPAVLLLVLVGWPILRIYGQAYASNGYLPLIILASSHLFAGISWLGDTWLNIRRRSRAYFLMNAFNAIVTLGFVYLLAPHGLVATALGWLCGQVLAAAVYLAFFARDQLQLLGGRFKTS